MTSKKNPTAPGAALLSDTAIAASIPADHPEGIDDGLAEGLARTLARKRNDLVASLKPTKPRGPLKSDVSMAGRQSKAVRKFHIGPRSGHK